MPEEREVAALPKWLPWVAVLLVIAGIAVSTYLTIAHYTTPSVLACPENSIINCGKVTTSAYSSILGIPLALLGLLFFIGMLPLQIPWAWRQKHQLMVWARLAYSGSGIIMIFWLIYVELFKLNAICLYCTAVHVITAVLFGLTAIGTALLED